MGLLRTAIGAASWISHQAGARMAAEVFLRPRKFARPKAESRLLWLGNSFEVAYGDAPETAIPGIGGKAALWWC
jgi:hypothetical protein